MAEPVASLVIVAYGGTELVDRLLRSIAAHTPQAHEVVVVDNDSPDGLADDIEESHPGARVVRAGDNLGYGGGANLGVANSSARRVVLLNSDVAVTSGWLEPLLRALDEPSVAIAAPRTVDDGGETIEAGASITRDGHVHLIDADPARTDTSAHASARRVVTHASASCWAFRRHWFERVGGFDPAYGLGYYEDVDLSCLAAATGRSVVCCPDSVIRHDVGGSFGSELASRLSRRNHRRAERRWRWLNRSASESPELAAEAATRRSHGTVLVVGPVTSEDLDPRAVLHLAIVTATGLAEAALLSGPFHVIVAADVNEATEGLHTHHPIAEFCSPEGIEGALLRAGIAATASPRRRPWSEIALAGRGQW